MIPWKISLLLAVLSALLTVGGLYYFQQGVAREARTLRSQNNRMRLQAQQRTQVAAVAAAAPVSGIRATAPASLETIAPPARSSESYYRNEGNATPLATLQTFAWAGDRGDAALVGKLIYLDPTARAKAEAYWASLPASDRQEWKTLDAMAAAVLTKSIMLRPFPDAAILATATVEPIAENRVRLRLSGVPRDGTEYQRTADGWKYVITERDIDAYIRDAARSR